MNTKILLIEPDKEYSTFLKDSFTIENYTVITATDGAEGLELFEKSAPDLIISEVLLSKKDGLQLCREIRSRSSKPFLFISTKKELFDICLGLEIGADDYLCKPFDFKELLARTKAVYRRYNIISSKQEADTIEFDNIEISLKKYQVKVDGTTINFPPKEIELLFFMVSHEGQVFSRDQLLDKVWGYDYLGDSRTVDVHIKRLREKLSGVSSHWDIKTVWGVGYKFELKN